MNRNFKEFSDKIMVLRAKENESLEKLPESERVWAMFALHPWLKSFYEAFEEAELLPSQWSNHVD